MTEIKVNRIPARLKERPQWVLWRYEERDEKRTKPPFTVSGRPASHRDPTTWNSFEAVWQTYEKGVWDGIGYVLSDEDGLVGIDLDHCVSESGEIEEWALEIIARVDSYTELSPSETGIRIFTEGTLPDSAPPSGNKRNGMGPTKAGGLEMYRTLRYLTLTGQQIKKVPATIERREEVVLALHAELFPPDEKPERPAPAPSSATDMGDYELLSKIGAARNGPSVLALFNGDTSAHNGDDSAADLALCNHLAFWTGNDSDRIDRLFRQSRLYRDKWEREDYRNNTIQMAIDATKEVWEPGVPLEIEESPEETAAKQEALQTAKQLAGTLPALLKNDKGAAYEPTILAALALLERSDPAAYERARAACRDARIGLRRLDEEVKKINRAAETEQETERQRVREFLPDCAWGDLIVPFGYWLSEGATGRLEADDNGTILKKPFAFAPLLITERYHDVDSGTQALQLAYRRGKGDWHAHTVDRATALDAKKVIELANLGFPVASENARFIADYLHRFEAANFGSLRQARVSSHLGWQGEGGKLGFMWGRCLITPSGELTQPLQLDEIAPEDWRREWIAFRGAASGDEQIADGFHAQGTWEGYVELLKGVQQYPRVLVAFYLSFAPVLLQILNAPNPVADWSNVTSTGKTMALRVAGSVWGRPDEKAADSVIGTWDNTQVWLERASSVLHSLPVILDDTKRVRSPQQVEQMVYTVTSGRGKGRGTVKGLARTRTWRTALLSSGEKKVTDFGKSGGAQARVLCITGIPFHTEDEPTRQVVDGLNNALQRHYGHAGPRFVQWIIQHREDWSAWVEEYDRVVAAYAASATNGAGGRMAQSAAVIDLAAALVHEAFPELGWVYQDPLSSLWAEMVQDAADAPPEIRALRDLVAWCYQRQDRFYDRQTHSGFTEERVPQGGWAGLWDHSNPDWLELAIYPGETRTQLKALGYDDGAVLSAWVQRGWLRVNQEKGRVRDTARVSFKGHLPHFHVLKRAAVDGIDD